MSRWCLLGLALPLLACASASPPDERAPAGGARERPVSVFSRQGREALLAGAVAAVAYSPYRAGQHPDRGSGAAEPTDDEIIEDLELLAREGGFPLLRLYDAGPLSERILHLVRARALPLRVMLGAWLSAEVSTHETCAWVTEPVPREVLQANARRNAREVDRAIALARAFPDTVVAVNVGNEVLVDWNDHRVSLESLLGYLEKTRAAIDQPVTVADNYVPWSLHPALGGAVDFAAVHTYPVWEGKAIGEGLAFTVENLAAVQAAHPGLPIVIGEAGWPSVASEFGERASEAHQTRYVRELTSWARAHDVTTFLFEAFDESWKGNPGDPLGAEKHWGLFDESRSPKQVVRELYPTLVPARSPAGSPSGR